jgi:hypothetical protein
MPQVAARGHGRDLRLPNHRTPRKVRRTIHFIQSLHTQLFGAA